MSWVIRTGVVSGIEINVSKGEKSKTGEVIQSTYYTYKGTES